MAKQKFSTIYDENYARLTLKYIYPHNFQNFVCADKPDLQNVSDKIGFEVARATSNYESIYNAFANLAQDNNMSYEDKKKLAMKMFHVQDEKDLPCEIYSFGSSPSKGAISPTAFLEDIKERNRLKNLKIKNYNRTNWNQLALYLFASIPFEEYEIKSILSELVSDSDFDFYIINVFGDLYCIQKDTSYEKYTISEADLKIFKNEALSVK